MWNDNNQVTYARVNLGSDSFESTSTSSSGGVAWNDKDSSTSSEAKGRKQSVYDSPKKDKRKSEVANKASSSSRES